MFNPPVGFKKKHPVYGMGDEKNGYYVIPLGDSLYAHAICSNGLGWEHVSVHIRDGEQMLTPEWEEMCKIKEMFWSDEDMVMQYHPPKSRYVNHHDHVLHLWRPVGINVPFPPKELV